jgi:hypothetical protein
MDPIQVFVASIIGITVILSVIVYVILRHAQSRPNECSRPAASFSRQ